MRPSFLPKCKHKLQGILPYQTNKDSSQKNCLRSTKNHQKKVLLFLFVWQGRNPCNFRFTFWKIRCPHKFILNLTDLYTKGSFPKRISLISWNIHFNSTKSCNHIKIKCSKHVQKIIQPIVLLSFHFSLKFKLNIAIPTKS